MPWGTDPWGSSGWGGFPVLPGVLFDGSVVINSTDVSDHITAIHINTTRTQIDGTLLGDRYLGYWPGVTSTTFGISFLQDMGAAQIDSVIRPLITSGGFPVVIKPYHGLPTSTTNPAWTATCIVGSPYGLDGGVGEAARASLTLQSTGTVTVATS